MAGLFMETRTTDMVRTYRSSMGVAIRLVVGSSSVGAGSDSVVSGCTMISDGFRSRDSCGEGC